MTGWRRWGSIAGFALFILGTPEDSFCVAFSNSARGTTGAQFLELPVGARGIAMGSAQGAAVNDATALYYNPAALASITGGNAVFMHSAYFEGMSYDYLSAAQRMRDWGTLGFGVQYFTPGSLEEVDNTGTSTGGSFKPADLAASLGYGRSLGDLELGAGMKYVSSKIQATATTFAVDMGARYHMGQLALSGGLANIGQGLKFREKRDSLPTSMRLGSSLELQRWVLALDLVSPRGASPFVGLGVEHAFPLQERTTIFGRAGYNSRTASSQLGTTAGMSFGTGLAARRLQFDYALVPFGDLGITHRISVSWRWGEARGGPLVSYQQKGRDYFDSDLKRKKQSVETYEDDYFPPTQPKRDDAADVNGGSRKIKLDHAIPNTMSKRQKAR